MKNIAEILKDCPKGIKLYSPILGDVEYLEYGHDTIWVKRPSTRANYSFDQFGRYLNIEDSECVLFPSKDNRDWDTFQRPFKDGDVLYIDCNDDGDTNERFQYIFILKEINESKIYSYCFVTGTNESKFKICYLADKPYHPRFATEEEKETLFKAIKDNGYKWNAETKTLDKLIEPKFKVGDRIKNKYVHKSDCAAEYIIIKVYAECYKTDCGILPFENQDDYELVPNKFDITTLKPFDNCRYSLDNGKTWKCAQYWYILENYDVNNIQVNIWEN